MALTAVLAAGCGADPPNGSVLDGPVRAPAASDRADLAGSGSTFVDPLMKEWARQYQSVAPDVHLAYDAVGSETALDRLREGEGQFATSEIPLPDVDVATLGGTQEVVQVPWAAGAVALAYNLPSVGELRLTEATLSQIFSGRIQRWDDSTLRADNPQVRLPSTSITVIHRSDGSGLTQILTSYMKATVDWELGVGFTSRFPRGPGYEGSDAVAAAVKRTTGAIGYIGVAHARQAELPVALLQNRAKRFVGPTAEAVNAALEGATIRSRNTTATLLYTGESPGAYPLSTVSYLLFRRDLLDPAAADALRHFGSWAVSHGQRWAESLGYVRLPSRFASRSLETLAMP